MERRDKGMHRFCSILLKWIVACLLGATTLVAKPSLTVAFSNWPPLKIIENGKFGGIDMLILDELATRTDIVFNFRECTWIQCMKMIESGEADLIPSLTKLS